MVPQIVVTAATFENDLAMSIGILSDITGQRVIGYRATNFSLHTKIAWFFDVLRKYNLTYDSSLCTSFFRKTFYIAPSTDLCFEISKNILEFPVSFLKIWPTRLPFGGGYFRSCPY